MNILDTNRIIAVIIGCLPLFFFTSCEEEENIETLETKRTELKTELLEVEEKIRKLDTTKVVNFSLVETGTVAIDTFKHKITVQGNVEANKDAMINAEMSGLITSINVSEGEHIRKGQTIAVIDTKILAKNIEEVQSQLEFAEYALNKQKQLMDKGLGTEFEFKQANNQVNALKNQLETLSAQKGKSIVQAPFDGIVDQIFPKQGELTGPQSPLIRLVNNSQVRIVADISERHYKSIEEGTPVLAFVPTLDDTIEVKVSNVGNYIHPTNRTFRVRADLNNNKLLLPNMLVELELTDLVLDSVVIVPSEAILKSQKNEDYLFVLHKAKEGYEVEQLNVKTLSKYNGKSAVVTSPRSIKKGELIVTKGGRGITKEDIVKIR